MDAVTTKLVPMDFASRIADETKIASVEKLASVEFALKNVSVHGIARMDSTASKEFVVVDIRFISGGKFSLTLGKLIYKFNNFRFSFQF